MFKFRGLIMQGEINKISAINEHIISNICLYTYCFECPLNKDGVDEECDLKILMNAVNTIKNKLGEVK